MHSAPSRAESTLLLKILFPLALSKTAKTIFSGGGFFPFALFGLCFFSVRFSVENFKEISTLKSVECEGKTYRFLQEIEKQLIIN